MEYENILKDMYSKLHKKHEFILGPLDTDSISLIKQDGSVFSLEEQNLLMEEINSLLPKFITFANDGYFSKVIVLRAKNYILRDEKGKIKYRGSALKSSKIELALSLFMKEIINALLEDRQQDLFNIYNTYIKECHNVTDITRWSSKKTLTEKVMSSERTNESKIRDALGSIPMQIGDKFRVYFTKDKTLKLQEYWTNDHSPEQLMARVFSTLTIFKNVINMNQFPKYHLKNKQVKLQLEELLK